jgi:hypothetical protein
MHFWIFYRQHSWRRMESCTPWAALVGCKMWDRLCTPRCLHQFVRSKHKFLRFLHRSEDPRFWMFQRRSHRCEFWEFCIVYLQTELIYLWRKLNPKIESEKTYQRPQISQDIRAPEDLTADRMFALASGPKFQRLLFEFIKYFYGRSK